MSEIASRSRHCSVFVVARLSKRLTGCHPPERTAPSGHRSKRLRTPPGDQRSTACFFEAFKVRNPLNHDIRAHSRTRHRLRHFTTRTTPDLQLVSLSDRFPYGGTATRVASNRFTLPSQLCIVRFSTVQNRLGACQEDLPLHRRSYLLLATASKWQYDMRTVCRCFGLMGREDGRSARILREGLGDRPRLIGS